LAPAEIIGNTTYAIDLTSAKEAAKKATWATPDRITVTADGLGWGKNADQGSRNLWLEPEPIGIGYSWRPTSIATIRAKVEQPGVSGMLYARYSADRKHWTAWQYVEGTNTAADPSLTPSFQGTLRVPYRDTEGYHKLRMDYARRDDVPWSSDEEALVKEILKGEPKYFEKRPPFIGYVQFLYEAQLPGGHRIKRLSFDIGWFMGGKHTRPRNENAATGRDMPWRFVAEE
jgi:hypothetical protein